MIWEWLAGIIIAIAGGAAGASIISGINERKLHKMERKEALEDKAALNTEEQLKELRTKVDALVESTKYIMFDRIRWLGQQYINVGEIDFDDRRILHAMHESYHNGLGGNGDLDKLMESVFALPLKPRD